MRRASITGNAHRASVAERQRELPPISGNKGTPPCPKRIAIIHALTSVTDTHRPDQYRFLAKVERRMLDLGLLWNAPSDR